LRGSPPQHSRALLLPYRLPSRLQVAPAQARKPILCLGFEYDREAVGCCHLMSLPEAAILNVCGVPAKSGLILSDTSSSLLKSAHDRFWNFGRMRTYPHRFAPHHARKCQFGRTGGPGLSHRANAQAARKSRVFAAAHHNPFNGIWWEGVLRRFGRTYPPRPARPFASC
jgi:hypothetical protein